MSVEAMKIEVENQVEDLPRFASILLRQVPSMANPSRMIFTGSGDSYAAALFAEELSNSAARSSDPRELASHPERAKGKIVVIISVSGRTRANLHLAKKIAKIADKRIVVTANPDSPLARLCDETVKLEYRKAGKLTSGTASFTTAMLACAHLLGRLPRKLSLETAMEKAIRWARTIRASTESTFYFVGSGVNRALAEYGACKAHEVLGARADALLPEQLGHSLLFSIAKGSDTIICVANGRNDPTSRISRILATSSFQTHSIPRQSPDVVARSLKISFHLQHLFLSLARKKGLKECPFLTDRSRLQISNRLIY